MIDPTDAPRECGTCHACCIWLGIDAEATDSTVKVMKFPGHTCHNCNAYPSPDRKCQVYERRPTACRTYLCGWRNGFLDSADGRPDQSGLLLSTYAGNIENGKGEKTATIALIDPAKAGELGQSDGHLQHLLTELFAHGFVDVRLVNYVTKSVVHFLRGTIYQGELLPFVKDPEELSFVTYNPPIGTYGLGQRSPHPEGEVTSPTPTESDPHA